MRRTAALIAGGGPAGAAAALTLARVGMQALVLERERATRDPLCGGFMSWRTLEALGQLGVAPERLGGHAIDTVRIFAGTRRLEARLPAAGMGLSRHVLDSALLTAAEKAGAGIERGVAIRAAEGDTLRLADGATIAGEGLFLATGKHELRGLARPAAAGDAAIGLRARLAASPSLRRAVGGAIELHALRGGYAGLLLQEDGSANLCLAIRGSRLADARGDPVALLGVLGDEAPSLGERIGMATATGPADAVARVPYGWRARSGRHGLFRIGDQAGVIPSLAGEGIGIALASGVAAARAFTRGGAEAALGFQPALGRRLALPIGLASALRAGIERPRLARLLLALAPPALLRPLAAATRIDRGLTGFGPDPIFAP